MLAGEAGKARRARGAGQVRSEVRSSGFEVPKTSNFGPRALARRARRARRARPARPASLALLSFGRLATIICLNRQNQENGT